VDHFGEHTVQMVMGTLDAAVLLLAAVLLILLSVHLATSAIERPTLARVPARTGRPVLPDRSGLHAEIGLHTTSGARAPPGASLRPSPAPPGDSRSG
jgi:hypothetical protein